MIMITFKDTLKQYEKLSFAKQLEAEKQLFQQYQHHDFPEYKKARLAHLKKINADKKLNALIDHLNFYSPRIAVFAGSFSPFHKGHYNILQKAEKIFDKVIIAFGKNPEKEKREWQRPKTIKNRQICEYSGLLTDFVGSLKYDVTIVRGLRNSTDFQYEQNQYRYLQELKPGIKIVNIFCDKEFEHISSSGIRTLEQYKKHKQYLLD
jgi:pantetheine-phosphate adenylyltransferase